MTCQFTTRWQHLCRGNQPIRFCPAETRFWDEVLSFVSDLFGSVLLQVPADDP